MPEAVEPAKERYLGDGVYCKDDGHYVLIYTYTGSQVTNEMYLEKDVYESLKRFCDEKFNLTAVNVKE